MRKHWLFIGIVAATLAACDNNNGTPPTPTPTPTPSATTLAAFMAQLFSTTSETATPVEINGLQLDTSSEDDSQFNALII